MQEIIRISKALGLTHIGSNLNVYPVLKEIYSKNPFRVVMSNAHSHLAHLVVKDELTKDSTGLVQGVAEELIEKHGIHCDKKAGCDASGGSLGHGVGIGIGMALAHPDEDIYVTVSDGSLQEGSEWEALRIAKQLKLRNLHVHACLNGYTAVAEISRTELGARLQRYPFVKVHYTNNGDLPEMQGLGGHYNKL